jgi:DNA-binding response OmpR family regulator
VVMEQVLLRERILVVDGGPSLAVDLKRVLEGAGAVVARGGLKEALRLAQLSRPSLTILDCHPDSAERRALIRQLRRHGLPFVLYAADPPSDASTERGALFISKPCPPARMVTAVRFLLGSGRPTRVTEV